MNYTVYFFFFVIYASLVVAITAQSLCEVSFSVEELHEELSLEEALCWAPMLSLLYSSHLHMMSGPAIDISNITANMTTLTPAAFISAALFLCQCEIPFEFQMEHKQPII